MTEIDKDYLNDLKRIKETIKENQNKAMVIVNSAMILTYYEIGIIINQRKKWGNKYIERLSEDLREYGKGYSCDQLKRMSRFAKEFTIDEIRAQAAPQIPWYTLVIIMQKSKSHEEMIWYINEAHKNGWSRSMVLNQFELKAYDRSLIEPSTTSIIKSDDLVKDLFKDTYVFNFLDRESIKTERDLKKKLVDNVIKFLQELGSGFSMVGKEYRIRTPSNEDFYIDLLMYHTKIHSYIVIEVKIDKFKPSDIGQLMFYVNAVNKLEKTAKDEKTIGLLLCKEADSFVTKTTLENINLRIGVSKYKIIDEIKEYLIKRLSEQEKGTP